jgi:hypothetical protein
MKTYGKVDVQIHAFVTLAPIGGQWSASCTGYFGPGKRAAGSHWTRNCVGPTTSLDHVKRRKFLSYQDSSPQSAAKTISLFWLPHRYNTKTHFKRRGYVPSHIRKGTTSTHLIDTLSHSASCKLQHWLLYIAAEQLVSHLHI